MPGYVSIGSLCDGCTGSEEKVMQSYIYDLDNIIRLGNYDRARIAAEVLCEQGADEGKAAEEKIFSVMDEMETKVLKGDSDRLQLARSVQAAGIALDILEKESGNSLATRGNAVVVSPGEPGDDWSSIFMKEILRTRGYKVVLKGMTEAESLIFEKPEVIAIGRTPYNGERVRFLKKNIQNSFPECRIEDFSWGK